MSKTTMTPTEADCACSWLADLSQQAEFNRRCVADLQERHVLDREQTQEANTLRTLLASVDYHADELRKLLAQTKGGPR